MSEDTRTDAADEVANPLISGSWIDTTDTKRVIVRYANQNRRFYNNLCLALAAAFYVTIFGSPVYSTYVSWVLFGEKHRLVNGTFVSECPDNKLGPKVNIGSDIHPILVNYNATFIKEKTEMYAWCGFLPASYFAAWPSVVQTAIFTIYMNTGSTVKLAWQCIAGTFSAILNLYFLNVLFPGGAASDSYKGYGDVIAWLDLILVLFLYLASGTDTNTKKMGMNWTVCLMLHFMNPKTGSTFGKWESFIPYVNWDAETTVVMLTSIMGCMLAVLATTFPMPWLNIRHVHDDAAELTRAIDNIVEESLEYWVGAKGGPKQFRISAKLLAFSSIAKRVEQNLKDSFWETFNLFSFGRKRKLYKLYLRAIHQNDDEIYLLKSALETVNFDQCHAKFVSKVSQPLRLLKATAMDCLRIGVQSCKDGCITPGEKDNILQKVNFMETIQRDLSIQYQLATRDVPHVSSDLAADSLFVFGASKWAREVADFCRTVAEFEDHWKGSKYSNPCNGLAVMSIHQLQKIFDPKQMFSAEMLRGALIDGLPIIITYAMSMYLDCSALTMHSSMMPGTLTLLVTGDNICGSTFFQNIQRLMGVVFGQTLPLLVMSSISALDCDSNVRFYIHLLSIFIFNFAFLFMYYDSEKWSLIGLCVVGFGCYPMFHQCDEQEVIDHEAQYKLIAEVIVAILVKMLVARLLMPKEPRDYAMDSMAKLIIATKCAYCDFFLTGEVEDRETGLKARRDDVRKCLAQCEAILPKCDPSWQIVSGMRTPFRHDLFSQALNQFRLVISDLDMLTLAMAGHEEIQSPIEVRVTQLENMEAEQKDRKEEERREDQEEALFKILSCQPSWEIIKQDMLHTLDNVMDMLMTVLAQDTEEALEDDAIKRIMGMDRILELDGVSQFYDELSTSKNDVKKEEEISKDTRNITQLKRTRLVLAIHAFVLSVKHVGQISTACFNHMVYC